MNYVTDILENQGIEAWENLSLGDLPNERWEQFHESKRKLFLVSDCGRIKTITKLNGIQRIKQQKISNTERPYINISDNEVEHISRLVAKMFILNPDNLPVVAHNDNNPKNNHVSNLRWDTQAGNMRQAYDEGRIDNNVPTIALDSNGEVIAYHHGIGEALSSYDGRHVNYSKDVHVIGNVIVMKQAYHESLTNDELFAIVTDCFNRMVEYTYVVDEQLFDNAKQAATLIECTPANVAQRTKHKQFVNIKGHNVSRMANMLGVNGYEK